MVQNRVNSGDLFVQFVSSLTGTGASISGVTPYDNTIPQSGEGTQVMTVSITPKYSNSILFITFSAFTTRATATGTMTAALFQDSTANALAAKAMHAGVGKLTDFNLNYSMTSGTTSSTTFKIRIGVDANSCQFLGDSAAGQLYGGVANGVLTVTEYL